MELARTPELSSQGFLGVKRHHITGFGEKNHVNGQVSVHFPWMNKNGPVEPQAYASMCWYLIYVLIFLPVNVMAFQSTWPA
jgi:hypothetical protein